MSPVLCIIGGCNGAGKTTLARELLPWLGLMRFLTAVELGQIEMVRSPIHDLGTSRSPREFRRLWVEDCLNLATLKAPLTQKVKERALELEALGVKAIDALHGASAEAVQCSHLLTCDDPFLKRYRGTLEALNPADFVVKYSHQAP